jgi:hypothetical protein
MPSKILEGRLKMADFIINVDTNDIKKEKHISWNVIEHPERGEYWLYEIVERYYEHPNAKGIAFMINIEQVFIRSFSIVDKLKASHLIQLQAALNTVSQIEALSKEN